MDSLLQPEQIASIAGLAAVLLLWRWATMGWRAIAGSSHSSITRYRNVAVTIGLGLAGLSVVLSSFSHPIISGAIALIAVVTHSLLEPSRETFWHHRRVRLVALTMLSGALLLHLLAPFGTIGGILAAVLIFHQHHRQNRRLVARLLGEIQEMSRRQLRLSTELRNRAIAAGDSPDDNLDQAG